MPRPPADVLIDDVGLLRGTSAVPGATEAREGQLDGRRDGDLLDEWMLGGLLALANARYGLGARTLMRGGLALVRARIRRPRPGR